MVALLLVAITEVPYEVARRATPEGFRFGGAITNPGDLNMYFSFIRQARDGHWLFVNRLTHLPHARAFFNPEWLAVGLAMRILGLSDTTGFEAWRMLGCFVLVWGFWCLAGQVLAEPAARGLALVLFAFGGGFGWLLLAGGGAVDPSKGLAAVLGVDLSLAVHPFAQALGNPHFSLPHGVLLLSLALFLRGEADGALPWYAASAAAALAAGAMRPYDLITLWVVLPIHTLLSPERFDRRRLLGRLLPLAATAPLLAYLAVLFTFSPVFKYWARQGEVVPVRMAGHLLSLGLAGFLVLVRALRIRAVPLCPPERLLLVWTACLLALVHSREIAPFLPFSPQLVIPEMGPLVLLAVPAVGVGPRVGQGRWRWLVAIGLLIAANSATSVALVVQRSRAVPASPDYYYVRATELEAYSWLDARAAEGDVVLSDLPTGSRLGRYVSARVSLGHYSVTPRVRETEAEVDAFLAGRMSPGRARSYLAELGIRWIVVRRDPAGAGMDPESVPGCRRQYRRGRVTVYSFEPGIA